MEYRIKTKICRVIRDRQNIHLPSSSNSDSESSDGAKQTGFKSVWS